MRFNNIPEALKVLLLCIVFTVVSVLVMEVKYRDKSIQTPEEPIPAEEMIETGQEPEFSSRGISYSSREEDIFVDQDVEVPLPSIPARSRQFSGGDEVIPPPPITYRTADQRPVQADAADSTGGSSSGFKLKGVATVGDDSFAIILDTKTMKTRKYHVNDVINNSRITEISREKVVLENENGSQSLQLYSDYNNRTGSDGSNRSGSDRVFGPVQANGPPPPDPSKSSLGEEVASRLPAMIRQKDR